MKDSMDFGYVEQNADGTWFYVLWGAGSEMDFETEEEAYEALLQERGE